MKRDEIIARLQIIHTWASYADERDMVLAGEEVKRIAAWSMDAVELLRGQPTGHTPERPRIKGRVTHYYVCASCGAEIEKGENFCKHCGQEAKWED